MSFTAGGWKNRGVSAFSVAPFLLLDGSVSLDCRECSDEIVWSQSDEPTQRVSHEAIYLALYALPRGELRSALLAQWRQGHKVRRPRRRGQDRRGGLRNMTSIHEHPAEVATREVPGQWEGDLIKGAGNRSAVGTLVERTSRYVILAGWRAPMPRRP
jgi:IS30 family transposase